MENQVSGIPQKSRKKSESKDEKRFVVKTNKGYTESFDSLTDARGQYDILKKKAMKQKEPIKMEIVEHSAKGQKTIDQVNVTAKYYGED
jgi:hypothetical protein